jgi:hypothetical protein
MSIIGWLVALGGMFLGAAASLWGLTEINRSVVIWFVGFPGFMCLVVALGFEFEKFAVVQKPEIPDRPWVGVEVEPVGPLAYDDKGWDAGTRWHIPLKYELKNSGPIPAVGAEFHANLIPFMFSHWPSERIKDEKPQGLPEPGTDVASELRKMCDNFGDMIAHFPSSGQTLFRDSPRRGFFQINGNPAVFEAAKRSQGYSGNFVILVCAAYRLTNGGEVHRTGNSFALFKNSGARKIDLSGETIPLSELGFTEQPMGGSFRD